MSEIALLSAMSCREDYDNYQRYIKKHTLTPTVNSILSDLAKFYEKYDVDEVDWGDFSSWFKTIAHPTMDAEKMAPYSMVFELVEDYEGGEVVTDIIDMYVELDYATRILDIASHLVDQDGKHSIADIRDLCDKYEDHASVAVTEASGEVHLGLGELLDKTVTGEGYEWKLEDLNSSLGLARLGDMIGLVARPEVGKTTLAMAEATHLVSQMDNATCIVFNNEESSEKLKLRSYQSVLGKDSMEILRDVPKSEKAYLDYLGTNQFIVWKPANGYMTKRSVEQKIKQHDPKVVVFNVLDKVHGFNSQNEVQAGRERAQWARELAGQGRIVIVLLQADATAEGQQWLDQSQIYGSKTGVQGETDALIMVGKNHDMSCEDMRYLSITRNKLSGGGKLWQPADKYLRSELKFDPHRAQYKTTRFKT